jgi:hypothetical protein
LGTTNVKLPNATVFHAELEAEKSGLKQKKEAGDIGPVEIGPDEIGPANRT